MRQVTCQEYLSNPAMREHIEAQARRARSEAVRKFTVAPFKWLFQREPALQLKTA